LHELASQLGIQRTLKQYGVITSWEEIVGEQIARVAAPQRIDNGTLYVTVSTAPWRAELSMRRREIIQKVNQHAGAEVIRDIRFR
jgi:predicted nucleic acid-binding Zn ribbon protein